MLLENTELSKLYEELVIDKQILSHDEFFNNHAIYANNEKIRRFNEQENPRNSDFFITKRRENENKEEMIIMRIEDKEKLLEQFPELREKYKKLHLESFHDQPEVEAKFWDEFWRLQKERKTLLYGGETKESKEVMKNLPVFSETGGEANITSEQDGLDLLHFREKEDDLYEKYIFKSKNEDNKDYIAEMLNNHSIMIKTKETDLKKRMDGVRSDSKRDIDYEKSKFSDEKDQPSTIKKKKTVIEEEDEFKKKFAPNQQQEMMNLWSDFQKERSGRLQSRMPLF